MTARLGRAAGWVAGRRWVDIGAYLSLAVFVALYVRLFAINDLLANVHAFLVTQMLIYAAYASLAFFLLRGARIATAWLVAVAAVAAILLLLLKTNMSIDVYRYLWDGGVLRLGLNPYLILPVDQSLTTLQASDLWKWQYWKYEYTPYPPLAQIIFASAYTGYAWLGPAGGKLVMALPVVILAVALYRRVERHWFALFILNPLLLFETFNGAHVDIWATMFTVLAYLQFGGGKVALSASLLAFGTLSKMFPAIFLPIFLADLVRRGRRRDALKYLGVFGGIVAAFYLPFMISSPFPVLRYLSYVRTFQFNALVLGLLKRALQPIPGGEAIALQICAAALVLILVYLALRYRVSALVLCAAYVFYLLLSTQVYAWYTVFLVPMVFLCFDEGLKSNRVYGFIAIQALAGLLYFVGSPIAGRASAAQKDAASLIVPGIEIALIALAFLWFGGWLRTPARGTFPAPLRVDGEQPKC